MKTALILVLLTYSVFGQTTLNYLNDDTQVHFTINSEEGMVVVGFQEQQDVREFVFCSFDECNCKDMVAVGRVHPSQSEIQQITNVSCIDQNTITFDRSPNGLTPYLWNNPFSKERRITQQSTTTYTDTDMTGSIVVDSSFTLKWKFNTDSTIEFAVLWSKKSWIGIGFGAGMNNVDMVVANIGASDVITLLDCYSTGNSSPPADTQNDLTLISQSVTDSLIKFRFSRKMNTGDAKDKTLVKDSKYTFSYAYSSALTLQQHSGFKEFTVTLSETQQQGGVTKNSYFIGTIIMMIMMVLN